MQKLRSTRIKEGSWRKPYIQLTVLTFSVTSRLFFFCPCRPIYSYTWSHRHIYRVSQKEKSIFWEVTVSAILSKKCICTCVVFRTVSEIQLFHCAVHRTFYRRTTSHVLTRVAKCIDVDGGIFGNVLYDILGKLYQLCHLNNKYRYQKQYVISLSYQQFWNCTVNRSTSESVRKKTQDVHTFSV
jgi:hypothetical protein